MACGIVVAANVAGQTSVFWDINGATAGSSGTTAATGTWDQNTTSNWTTDSTGASTTGTWQTKSAGSGVAIFSAGTNATGASTVTVSGTITGVRGITFEEGTVTLSGGTLTLGASSNIDTGANSATISSVVAGTGFGITKLGSGTLTLSGANTFTGSTIIGSANGATGGTLALGAANVIPNTAVTIYGGTLDLINRSETIGALTLGGGASGTTATVTGTTGTLTLGGNVTYDATNNANGATISTALALGASRTFTVGDSTGAAVDLTVSDIISGSGFNLTKAGAGTLLLSAVNTYTGTTTISEGTIAVGVNSASGSNGALGKSSTAVVLNDAGTGTSDTALTIATSAVSVGRAITVANSGTGTTTIGGDTSLTSGTGTFSGVTTLNKSANLQAAGTANITFSGQLTGTGGITKVGDGTVTLSSTSNNYSGTTNIGTAGGVTGGTLALGASSVLPGTAVNIYGGTLSMGTFNDTSGALSLGGGASGTSASITGTGTLTLGGNVTFDATNDANGATISSRLALGASRIFNIGDSTATTSDLTVSGIVSGATFGIDKQGAGTLVLSGVNTYSGTTTVTAGTLRATTSVSALGTGSLTLAGGTLELANDSALNFARNTTVTASSTVTSGRLTSGTGFTQTLGTLGIGTQTLSIAPGGLLSANSGYGITFGATTLSGNSTFDVTNNGSGVGALTLGAIADGGGARTITKSGTGELTLGSAATSLITGTAVNITGGTLNSNNATALGTLANVTLSSGATLSLGASQTLGALNGTGGTASLGANTLTLGSTNNLTSSFGGAITGTGALTKAGTGTATLSGTNTYSGATTVSAGTLTGTGNSSLGDTAGTVTVNSGATLALGAATIITKSATLTLTGVGAAGANGALVAGGASGTTSQWNGNITLAGNATVGAGGNLLILGEGSTFTNTIGLGANTLTFNTPSAATVTPTYTVPSYILDPSNILVNSAISGTGGLTKTGTGTLTLMPIASGGSTFTGATTITGGKLIVDSQVNMPALNSTQIYVGNSASPGSADTVVLQMGQLASPPAGSNTLGTYNAGTNASASNLTVYADGLYNMNGASNGFANLTLQGGHVSGGNASYSPLLTLTGNVTTNAAARTAVMDNGFVALSANSFAFNIATGTTASGIDLQVDSIIQNGVGYTGGAAGTSLSKAGTGKMVLTGANTFAGITSVTAGILNIQNAAALGQVGSVFGSTNNGTVVSSGAQLQIQGGITVGAETLTLNGTGISTDGALRNISGNNTYNGFVNLASDARINADSGSTLTIANTNGVNAGILNGTVAGKNLTVGGAGDTIINGGIGANISNLTKADAGTLTLAGTNGYVGATTVSSGVLKLTNSNALSGTGVTVANGAAMHFAQDAGSANIAVVGVASTINGTGISNGGAIQNLNGTNSYAGAVTLGSNSRITAASGSTFTLSGNVNGATFAIDAGGAGSTTYSGVISGTGTTFTKSDSGSVTLSGSSPNTFTGATTVKDGTLNLDKTGGGAVGNVTVGDGAGGANSATLKLLQANQISDTSRITILGDGKFNLNGLNETIGSFAGTGTIDTGSATLITGGDNTSTTFGGVLAGSGVIQKTGIGTLTFNASMSYSGELNLTGGTLALAGVNFTVGTLRITGNTVLDFGLNTASILSATNVIIENGATLTITNWVDNQDFFYATGSFIGLVGVTTTPVTQNVRGVAPQNQITFTGFSNNSTIWQSLDRQITPAPEPATYGALFLGGCLGLLGWRRLSRRRVSGA